MSSSAGTKLAFCGLKSTPVAAPQARKRIAAIDGLRGLAVLMVYVYHVWQFSGSPPVVAVGKSTVGSAIAQFPAGVDLFMVLSGFCLFWPFCNKPLLLDEWSISDYARRRVRRIVPPYYAAILFVTLLPVVLVALMKGLGQQANWQPLPSFWQYFAHLLFLHTLFLPTWDGIQGVFWSLGLEMQFYIAFPVVVLLYRKVGIRIVVWMTLISVIYRIAAGVYTSGASWETQFLASIFFLGRWMQFAAGMLAAWLVARAHHEGRRFGTPQTYGLLALAALSYIVAVTRTPLSGPLFPTRDLGLAFSFAVLACALCAGKASAIRLFESRALASLGFISYSVFLIHQNFAYYMSELLRKVLGVGGEMRLLLLVSIGFAVVLMVSYLFHVFVERPFLNPAKAAPRPLEPSLGARVTS